MRRVWFLVILTASAATAASGQPDSRTTIYKGPVHIVLPCGGHDLSVRHVTEESAIDGQNSTVCVQGHLVEGMQPQRLSPL
jgi:hypothetical protein